MMLMALQGLTQIALPLITQGSSNVFSLKSPFEHIFHPFQRKKINSKLALSSSSGDAFLGCMNDKLRDPFQLMTKYILPGQIGQEIMFDIFNNSQVNQTIHKGQPISQLAVCGCANNDNPNYTQSVYALKQCQLSAGSQMDVNTNLGDSNYPCIFKGVQSDFVTSAHLNSSVVCIKNLTSKKIKIQTTTLLGQAVALFFNASDQATINQSKPSGLNVNTLSQPSGYGNNHQLQIPFDILNSSDQKKHILPFQIQGLLSSPDTSGRKYKGTNYERMTLLKDTAFNLINQFVLKQTFKSDWSSAQQLVTTQIHDQPHNKKQEKQQKHKKKRGLLGMIFAPITAITSHLFIQKSYKVKQFEQLCIQTLYLCRQIKIKGQVEANFINNKLTIKSFQQQTIQIEFIY